MRVRYFSLLALAAAAAFLVVATAAYSLPIVDGLALGVGIGMLAVSLGIVARYRDHLPTAAVGGAAAIVSGWMIVASQVFPLSVVENLTFAGALAIGGLAAAGLIMHELRTERVVHSLEVGAGERRPTEQPQRFAA